MKSIQITKPVAGEVLEDRSATGKNRPWREKRIANELLSIAYDEVDKRKARLLRECASFLEFDVAQNGEKRLANANFCRVRLCPMCAWRRSLKTYLHVRKVVDALDGKYVYILLTLTVRNVRGEDLSATIDEMMAGWHRFIKRKSLQIIKGWYRGLEITHNVKVGDEWYDTFHPHFHVLLAVLPSYFKKQDYINHDDWVALWKRAMRLDYDPQVDVRRVSGNMGKDIAEVAKYTVKDGDYIDPEDWDLTVATVRVLDPALDGRRLVAFGGELKAMHQKLNLDDEVDGDLIRADEEEMLADENLRREIYAWNTGYKQYVRQ